MRLLIIAGLLALLPWTATAAPTWQVISSEPGKRIELDRTSLKREGNSVQAQGRVVLEKELIDGKSGAGYRVIEAITRYDCGTRSANTIKRIFKKNESDVIREEDIRGAELPVRSGTLDDKVLREVCRPPQGKPGGAGQEGQRGGQRTEGRQRGRGQEGNGQGRETGGDQGVRFTGQGCRAGSHSIDSPQPEGSR